MGKLVYIRDKAKTKANEPGLWDESKRIEAITMYLAIGNLTEVSRQMGIPIDTLKHWKNKTPWWKDIETQIKEEKNSSLSATVTNIVEKALNQVVDRIENGDFIFDQRTGEIRRIPVKVATLNSISSVLIDKRLLLNKQPTVIHGTSEGLDSKLDTLAKAFKSFVEKKELKDINERDSSNNFTQLEDGTIMDDNGLIVDLGERVGDKNASESLIETVGDHQITFPISAPQPD